MQVTNDGTLVSSAVLSELQSLFYTTVVAKRARENSTSIAIESPVGYISSVLKTHTHSLPPPPPKKSRVCLVHPRSSTIFGFPLFALLLYIYSRFEKTKTNKIGK